MYHLLENLVGLEEREIKKQTLKLMLKVLIEHILQKMLQICKQDKRNLMKDIINIIIEDGRRLI